MINFEKITLHNFGSYGHAEVSLANKGFCLVSGKNNYKKDNALSNGSGKSFLWSGICFALTGETIQGLHTNLKNINVDENSCYVSLEFTYNKDSYQITRYVEPRSDLKIIKNGTDVSGKGIRESEKKLGELLPDLNKDLIASAIIIGQGMPNKFSSFQPAERKGLLERLTKSDFMIEDIKERVAARTDEINSKVRALEDSLLVNNTKLGSVSLLLENARKELASADKPDFEGQIKASTDLCASIEKDIKETTAKIKDLEGKLETANKDLLEATSAKAAENAEELESYTSAHNQTLTEKLQVNNEISNLTKEITKLKSITDVCPTCGQKIPGAKKPDTTALEEDLKVKRETYNKLDETFNKQIQLHTEYLRDINSRHDTAIQKLNADYLAVKKELGTQKDSLADFSHAFDLEKENLSKIKFNQENWDKYIAGLNKTISDNEGEENSLKNAIRITEDGKVELLERLAVLKKMDTLIKRDFRGFLLTNIIAYIDKKAKEYSDIVFETKNLDVYLDGNALDITYDGKLIDNLSGGEKMRVDLILQLAIRDLLCNYFNFSSNILVLDEITDFLDKKSCDAIMNLLNSVLKDIESVFVISHHADSLNLPIDTTLEVIKDENGISSVKV